MALSPLVTSDEKQRVVSSALISTVECAAKGTSLINKRNRMGPNMLLCGTLAVTVLGEE